MSSINIEGIDKAALLAALYNNARPLGLGHLQAKTDPMTKDQAIEAIVAHRGRFDYLHGRPLKISFEGDKLWGARLYDRDQGEGECERIINEFRSGQPNGPAKEET